MNEHNTTSHTSALDSVTSSLHDASARAAPLLRQASEQVSELAHQGMDGLHDASNMVQTKLKQTGQSAVHYIQHDPIKAMLMSAAAGAALMALVTLVLRAPRSS